MDARPIPCADTLTPEIRSFLEPYPETVRDVAAALRTLVMDEAPGAVELVYDAYNAVALGYTFTGRPGDGFCHIAVYSRWVNLGFNWGADLPDPDGLLQGTGRRIRHLRFTRVGDVARPHVLEFLRQAAARATGFETAANCPGPRKSVVRAVYEKRRRPNRAGAEEDR